MIISARQISWASRNHRQCVAGYSAIFRVSSERQVIGETVPFTPDEIAIYRDFLLHYPDQTSNMIGMQDATVAFDAPLAFGYESNPRWVCENPPNSKRDRLRFET
jgi:hypothetical protein